VQTKISSGYVFNLLLAMLVLADLSAWAATEPILPTEISGHVTDAETGEPLLGANITILNRYGGCASDTEGDFVLGPLAEGVYKIRISHVGYESRTIDSLVVPSSEAIDMTIALVRRIVSIKGITVTPGVYSIMGNEPVAKQALTKDEIATRPQVSEDLFRAAQRLPGIINNDFSARFVVRGGEQDEVLINLDGLQLYEPFHLKDIDGGAVSITDVAAVEGVDLMAGGYPADYGDRMSGVFNIRSTNPTVEYTRMSAGLSATHARVLGEGYFAGNRGTWLVSARRGYLDLVLQAIGEDDQIRPNYYDLFSKVQYSLSGGQLLSASVLTARDNLTYEGSAADENNNYGDTLYSSYGNSYAWLTLHSYFAPNVNGRSIVSIGRVDDNREGQIFDAPHDVVEMAVYDDCAFNLSGLKSDWEYEPGKNFLVKAGFDYRHLSVAYDYLGRDFLYQVFNYGNGDIYQLDGIDTNRAVFERSGEQVSAYLSNRIRFFSAVTAEFGVRYDRATYTGDEDFSPRANLAISLTDQTRVKCGWGYFRQSERINEISVQDGERDFGPTERAEHFVVGLEHSDGPGKEIRINGFYKDYTDLRPAYRNTFGELVTFPELEEDRVKVEFNGKKAYGAEFYFINDEGGRLGWWLSYTISRVEDDIRSLYFFEEGVFVNYDRKIPFLYDQRHTMYLDLIYRIAPGWQINMAWQYHTGWPMTEVKAANSVGDNGTEPVLIAGEPWASQLEPYNRIDLRLNRKFTTSRGVLTAYVEVVNILDHKNVRNYEYWIAPNGSGYTLEREGENWFGVMPSFGLVYDFHL
jgi:hypothetical protein